MRLVILMTACVAALAMVSYAGPVVYGVDAFASISTTLPINSFGEGGTYSTTSSTDGYLPQPTYFVGLPLESQQSYVVADPQQGGALYNFNSQANVYTLFTNGSNGDLHLALQSSGGTLYPDAGVASSVQGQAYAYIYWTDVLVVTSDTGLPSGTPALLEMTPTLDGSIVDSGNQSTLLDYQVAVSPNTGPAVSSAACSALSAAYAGGQPTGDSINQFNSFSGPGTTIINLAQPYYLCTAIGDSFTLLEELTGDVNGSALWSGQVTANNTASINVVPLSPGVVIASASGENYSLSSAPEPAALFLVGAPLIFFWLCRRSFPARQLTK